MALECDSRLCNATTARPCLPRFSQPHTNTRRAQTHKNLRTRSHPRQDPALTSRSASSRHAVMTLTVPQVSAPLNDVRAPPPVIKSRLVHAARFVVRTVVRLISKCNTRPSRAPVFVLPCDVMVSILTSFGIPQPFASARFVYNAHHTHQNTQTPQSTRARASTRV
jgi:hypothetical protein